MSDIAASAADRIRYIVCAIPRSGSEYLCSLLAQTRHAGMTPFGEDQAWEYLRPHRLRQLGVSPRARALDVLERAFAFGTSANGVQGFKAMWAHFSLVLARGPGGRVAGAEAQARMSRTLAADVRWVYLRRRNHIAQAVSWARASLTGRWRTPAALHRDASFEPYNYLLIRHRLWLIRRHERGWGRFFTRIGVEPYEIWYEDFVSSPLPTVAAIGQYLGLSVPLCPPSSETHVRAQSDQTNLQWMERFRVDHRSRLTRGAALARTLFHSSTWKLFSRVLQRERIAEDE